MTNPRRTLRAHRFQGCGHRLPGHQLQNGCGLSKGSMNGVEWL